VEEEPQLLLVQVEREQRLPEILAVEMVAMVGKKLRTKMAVAVALVVIQEMVV
jgi:hypothetical protein